MKLNIFLKYGSMPAVNAGVLVCGKSIMVKRAIKEKYVANAQEGLQRYFCNRKSRKIKLCKDCTYHDDFCRTRNKSRKKRGYNTPCS